MEKEKKKRQKEEKNGTGNLANDDLRRDKGLKASNTLRTCIQKTKHRREKKNTKKTRWKKKTIKPHLKKKKHALNCHTDNAHGC